MPGRPDPRSACPCGSGRRYRVCHGHAPPFVARAFEGLSEETEWVAMRELLPAATARLHLRDQSGAPVLLATVLPMGGAALVRSDGIRLVAAQVAGPGADASRDLAGALLAVVAGEPGPVPVPIATEGPRLQDLLETGPLDVQVHDRFDFWFSPGDDRSGEVGAAKERADSLAVPSARLRSVVSAYWCRMRDKAHLRWVLPEAEEPLLDALARLAATRSLSLGPDTRFVGTFRAHGLLVPVWDLPRTTGPDDLEEPSYRLRERLAETLADPRPLRDEERRARAGLLTRQLTLR